MASSPPKPTPDPMPETIEDVAEELAATGGNGASPKARRRKRRPTPEPPPDVEAIMREATRGLFLVAFEIVAKRRGPHWKLSPKESDALGGAVDYWVKVRAPFLTAWAPEILVAGTLAAVLIPRIAEDRLQAARPADATVVN